MSHLQEIMNLTVVDNKDDTHGSSPLDEQFHDSITTQEDRIRDDNRPPEGVADFSNGEDPENPDVCQSKEFITRTSWCR